MVLLLCHPLQQYVQYSGSTTCYQEHLNIETFHLNITTLLGQSTTNLQIMPTVTKILQSPNNTKTRPKYTNKKACYNKCNRNNVMGDIPMYSSVLIQSHFRLNWVTHQEWQKLFIIKSNFAKDQFSPLRKSAAWCSDTATDWTLPYMCQCYLKTVNYSIKYFCRQLCPSI
jgi:hypothetical protein